MAKEINKEQIIEDLLKGGAKRYNNLRVRNTVATDEGDYVRVSLTTDKKIPAFVRNEKNGEFEESLSNIVWTSNFALSSVCKDNADLCCLANAVADASKSSILPLILNGCQVDIVVDKVAEGEYINPFSANETVSKLEHDTYIVYVIDVHHFSNTCQKLIDKVVELNALAIVKPN